MFPSMEGMLFQIYVVDTVYIYIYDLPIYKF